MTHPFWFKDAVIYQLHVKSFFDGNGDGIGDFQGLTQKLDYIRELGVDTIWLMPFFLSPLRDDGYDIADYTQINPAYGQLADFENFLREAHSRDLRVVTEMVMNHTSDQHTWFQKSRRAKPGEKWRDYYVWSDSSEKYREARIIFQDFEPSNWTWDPVANAFYWHRFYHHQPDLNFENPEVHEALLSAVDFWMDQGVDGMRLDAIPYLYEREGTNCENLEETHHFLKKLRSHIDTKYPDRMLLAEANQWPEDAALYFGDGDECHMNFHFPIMPRLFMAIEQEDCFPIIDIIEQTPKIPENCQWGIFLRNHDELTLEMVTDEDRDYMYRTFAKDQRAKVNLGIRRRLAPLLGDNRRKIELMNSLLFSLPGTPIIYYGDEIGMGDNIYLGDRDGVRTPMQWSEDRNAGFSSASSQKLYLPIISESTFNYSSRNVQVQENGTHSLLWWMRRIINIRKKHPAFGRGDIRFIKCENPKILAYLRTFENETIMVVANFSRFSQCAELDLATFRGQIPTELFGQTPFPPIGELPYFLTVGAHAFYWFKIDWKPSELPLPELELDRCVISGNWDSLFQGKALKKLQSVLPDYLQRHRWFAGKGKLIQAAKLLDVLTLNLKNLSDKKSAEGSESLTQMRILLVQISYVNGEPDIYSVPVIFAEGATAQNIQSDRPSAAILVVERKNDKRVATLCDPTKESEFWFTLTDAIRQNGIIAADEGSVTSLSMKDTVFDVRPATNEESSSTILVQDGEQSNTSAMISNRMIMKLFRRIDEGENPDVEFGKFLSLKPELKSVPKLIGALNYRTNDNRPYTLAAVHEYLPHQSDAWVYTIDELGRYIERVESQQLEPAVDEIVPSIRSLIHMADLTPPKQVADLIGPYLSWAGLIGKRTAELHLALSSSGTEANFQPIEFTRLYQRSLYQSIHTNSRRILNSLRQQRLRFSDSVQATMNYVIDHGEALMHEFRHLTDTRIHSQRIRCHGDYHLGQLLFTGKDFAIIDFEGEPERPIGERRIKTSPLRDVAGMIRSFHYATHEAMRRAAQKSITSPEKVKRVKEWLNIWYAWTSAKFLKNYLHDVVQRGILPHDRKSQEVLLNTYLLEKMFFELNYEMRNRPDWVEIPLNALAQFIMEQHKTER